MTFTELTPDAIAVIVEQAVRKVLSEKEQPAESNSFGRALDIREAAKYIGLTRQTIYRKTSANEIPHSKRAGRVFFDRQELDGWLLAKRVPTKTELQKQAGEHIADRARRPR
jgi:excisionase family DNA binding protein